MVVVVEDTIYKISFKEIIIIIIIIIIIGANH